MASMVGSAAGSTNGISGTWLLCRSFATLARAEPSMNGGILL